MWFWVAVLVLVVGAVAVFVAGRDDSMAEAYEDRPDRTIPTGRPLTVEDLEQVRFSSALRGYRMDEVDALIDRIAADLMEREQVAVAEQVEQSEEAVDEDPEAVDEDPDYAVDESEEAVDEDPAYAVDEAAIDDDASTHTDDDHVTRNTAR
jgi:DivIVA domain-containing protein